MTGFSQNNILLPRAFGPENMFALFTVGALLAIS